MKRGKIRCIWWGRWHRLDKLSTKLVINGICPNCGEKLFYEDYIEWDFEQEISIECKRCGIEYIREGRIVYFWKNYF